MSFREEILDHGYLKLVDCWGREDMESAVGEEAIIAAARMSTGKGFLGWGPIPTRVPSRLPSGGETIEEKPGDEKLLRFLWENKHATPFEMAGLTIEVMAPIFVFREWHRHRTQSYNEMSARYVPLPDVNYVPSVERLLLNSKTNKQAGVVAGAEQLDEHSAVYYQKDLVRCYQHAEELYQHALRAGVPKELARIHLPVGRYSRMRASANLRNWLGFVTLRSAPAAMWEIRQYSDALGKAIAEVFPRTWALFSEKR